MEMEQISKTQKKKEMTELQKLGEQLISLSPEKLNKIDMPQEVKEAILFAQKMKKHGALRRQRQLIGSLMRDIDPEPIRDALENIAHGNKVEKSMFHQVERWRDEILEGSDDILTQIIDNYPEIDRQYLVQLVRNARKEKAANKPPKSSRLLFRYLRNLLEKNNCTVSSPLPITEETFSE